MIVISVRKLLALQCHCRRDSVRVFFLETVVKLYYNFFFYLKYYIFLKGKFPLLKENIKFWFYKKLHDENKLHFTKKTVKEMVLINSVNLITIKSDNMLKLKQQKSKESAGVRVTFSDSISDIELDSLERDSLSPSFTSDSSSSSPSPLPEFKKYELKVDLLI